MTAPITRVGRYVGLEGGFTLLEDDTIAPYVDAIKAELGPAAVEAPMEDAAAAGEGGAAGEGAAGGEAAPMETE